MTAGLRIKQVVDATGFTASTLRYYEHIGLLPQTPRTAAGYRVYDQRALDRLAFIARAKHLGCSLEEISGLATAWDGGSRPRRRRLDRRVAARQPAMSAKRENTAIVGFGVAGCTVCCAGPILGLLAAIGVGTVAGLARFGTTALVIGVAAGAVMLFRRQRRSATCAPAAPRRAVTIELTETRARS